MTPLRANYIRDLVIHGRSEHTQEAHTRYLCDLACYYRRSPELISYEEVTGWLYHLITERQLSASSVLRPAPRLIHAFRQKPFWMRSGPAAAFAPSARPRLGNLGDWPSTNRAHRPFGKSSILLLKAVAAAIRPLQIPPRPRLHLIAHRTFPIH